MTSFDIFLYIVLPVISAAVIFLVMIMSFDDLVVSEMVDEALEDRPNTNH